MEQYGFFSYLSGGDWRFYAVHYSRVFSYRKGFCVLQNKKHIHKRFNVEKVLYRSLWDVEPLTTESWQIRIPNCPSVQWCRTLQQNVFLSIMVSNHLFWKPRTLIIHFKRETFFQLHSQNLLPEQNSQFEKSRRRK